MNAVTKRSVTIKGKSTSISLEDIFWDALRAMADARKATISETVVAINATRETGIKSNLSSAIRVAVLKHYQGSQA